MTRASSLPTRSVRFVAVQRVQRVQRNMHTRRIRWTRWGCSAHAQAKERHHGR